MTGWLVVNEFLNQNKFNEIHSWLLEAASSKGISLQLRTNAQILIDLPIGKLDKSVDFILFWDKDTKLAHYLEQMGYPVFNSSQAIGICDDKSLTHLKLMGAGIRMPRTVIAPKTFDNIGYTNYDFLKAVVEKLGFSMVVKEVFGSFGQQVHLVRTWEELLNTMTLTGTRPVIFQEYIETSFGRDIRLQVVGNKVIAGMLRFSENGDFRANLSIGGKMKPYVPTKEQSELAVRCCEIIGLDFAGVDLLFGDKDELLVCEVNSNAHFKNIYDCTGINAADAIIEHIHKNIINT
ncbi:RimK family alpha-L-glutamate ligase [Mobilitalea sibirica]|uniref:RimK family alpha-L-glutamate ligase n=2 Tax=Mobilitalea sibirica TaxID=1462919 RepID=A0A8J7L3C6_9FIRM|nr:RimK family alpha-L-glutamate ligase [Mobilitalea sibirica]